MVSIPGRRFQLVKALAVGEVFHGVFSFQFLFDGMRTALGVTRKDAGGWLDRDDFEASLEVRPSAVRAGFSVFPFNGVNGSPDRHPSIDGENFEKLVPIAAEVNLAGLEVLTEGKLTE